MNQLVLYEIHTDVQKPPEKETKELVCRHNQQYVILFYRLRCSYMRFRLWLHHTRRFYVSALLQNCTCRHSPLKVILHEVNYGKDTWYYTRYQLMGFFLREWRENGGEKITKKYKKREGTWRFSPPTLKWVLHEEIPVITFNWRTCKARNQTVRGARLYE